MIEDNQMDLNDDKLDYSQS